MKYYIVFRLDAKVEVEVDAGDTDEALEKGEQFMAEADFGPCEDISWDMRYIDDEYGNTVVDDR